MSHGFTIAAAQAHAEKHGYKLEFADFRATYGDATAVRAVEKTVEVLREAKEPNKTEAEFGRILASMKLRGEIVEYRYEGITLRWADMKYTPDWFVITAQAVSEVIEFGESNQSKPDWLRIKIIEVKGGHIWDRDIVRFKGARAAWPMFTFEMHQKKGGEWRRIH